MTTILTGDSRERLKELEDESIDALVTDPPYLINFMGKDWDKENSPAGDSSFWEEVLRVMKPGAHGLVFGHSRQHHRVMTALEDAGFEIRDCLMWFYGSGFPKSHNIGKSVDALRKTGKSNPKALKEVEQKHGGKSYKLKGKNNGIMGETVEWERKEYQTDTGWEGWGTALKPAYEPIILVRKPLEKKLTIAKNVLKHGVGGINIDASRIGTQEDFSNVKPRKMMSNQGSVKTDDHDHTASDTWQAAKDKLQNLGRFPANVLLSHHPDCKQVGEVEDTRSGGERTKTIFSEKEPVSGGEGTGGTMKATTTRKVYDCADDCAVKILDEQSGIKKGSGKQTKGSKSGGIWNKSTGKPAGDTYGDSGGASRFYKCVDDCPVKILDEQAPKTGNGHAPKTKITGFGKNYGGTTTYEGAGKRLDGLGGASRFFKCVDDCPVKILDEQSGTTKSSKRGNKYNKKTENREGYTPVQSDYREDNTYSDKGGASRFYKCVDDCPVKILDEQAPKTGNAFKKTRTKDTTGGSGDSWTNGGKKAGQDNGIFDGLGGASRFYYCAKVGKKERNAGDARNTHPTVKPIKLMTYLTKLITPPNGKVLDPFMGSGSTGMACAMEGFDFVGIDMDEDYVEISKARIEWARTQKEND